MLLFSENFCNLVKWYPFYFYKCFWPEKKCLASSKLLFWHYETFFRKEKTQRKFFEKLPIFDVYSCEEAFFNLLCSFIFFQLWKFDNILTLVSPHIQKTWFSWTLAGSRLVSYFFSLQKKPRLEFFWFFIPVWCNFFRYSIGYIGRACTVPSKLSKSRYFMILRI